MSINQNKRDVITYSVLLATSIILYFVVVPQQIVLRSSWSGDVSFTSQTFPKMLAIGLMVISSLGIMETLQKIAKQKKVNNESGKGPAGEKHSKTTESLYARLMPAITFLICILYTFLFAKLGFILASVIVMPIMLGLFGCKKWYYYASVYAFAASLYIVFRIILKVPLP